MGFSLEKVLLILLLAALIVGPERLPKITSSLAALVRRVRVYADDTKTRLKEEMGDEFEDIDWRDLDPRKYDPRRIIREALSEPLPQKEPSSSATSAAVARVLGGKDAEKPIQLDAVGGSSAVSSGVAHDDDFDADFDAEPSLRTAADDLKAASFDDQAT